VCLAAFADANDEAQFAELFTQGELTRRAWEKDVQVGVTLVQANWLLHDIDCRLAAHNVVCNA
jgi:thiamine biosynthesis protein ThiC